VWNVFIGDGRWCASLGGVDVEMARRRSVSTWQWCGTSENGRHLTRLGRLRALTRWWSGEEVWRWLRSQWVAWTRDGGQPLCCEEGDRSGYQLGRVIVMRAETCGMLVREVCLHDTAGMLTQGVVEVVKRGVSVSTVHGGVQDETVEVLEVSEECERACKRARQADYQRRSYVNAIRCHAACPALLPTPPSLPASISVAPCAFPAIAADGDPFGCLSAFNHDRHLIHYNC
jgi:hypothetical protein